MKVLVTGASGFIGDSICRYFYEILHEDVIGWDINVLERSWPIKNINLMDINTIQNGLQEINPDIIIHCAGAADVGRSIQDPVMDYESNVTITHNIFFALLKNNFTNTRVVFLSSAGVYGNPVCLPIKENSELNPLSPYALHKVMCEDVCKYFHKNFNIDVKIARVFSAYGEGLKKQIFWDMYNKGCLVKERKKQKLEMWGTGKESRDYIYIKDLIHALCLIATKSPKDEMIYNVANGEEITIKTAADVFADSFGLNKDCIEFNGKGHEGNPINWRADISKLRLLGFKRSVSFEEGVHNYVKWVKEQQ